MLKKKIKKNKSMNLILSLLFQFNYFIFTSNLKNIFVRKNNLKIKIKLIFYFKNININ